MNFFLEIVIDYFVWVFGIRSQDELSKGNKYKAYILFSIFIAIVVVMGIYSLVWMMGFIKI